MSTIQNQAMHAISRVRANRRIYLNKFFLRTLSLPTTPPAAADACISALLSLAVVKSRGPLPAGGTDCSTLRSTKGLNGASFWDKRAEREGEPAGRWQERKQQRAAILRFCFDRRRGV